MSLKSNPIQTHSIFTTVLTHFWSILEPSSPPGGEWSTIYLKLQVQIFCFGTIRNASCHLLASFGFLVHIEVLLVVGLGLPLYAESAFPTDIFNSSCHSARPHDTESPWRWCKKENRFECRQEGWWFQEDSPSSIFFQTSIGELKRSGKNEKHQQKTDLQHFYFDQLTRSTGLDRTFWMANNNRSDCECRHNKKLWTIGFHRTLSGKFQVGRTIRCSINQSTTIHLFPVSLLLRF